MTLEDETGIANIIVWPKVYEKYRRIVLGGRMIAVEGLLQKEQNVIHVIARRIIDLTPNLVAAMTAPHFACSAHHLPAAFQNPRRHPRSVRVLPKGRNFL